MTLQGTVTLVSLFAPHRDTGKLTCSDTKVVVSAKSTSDPQACKPFPPDPNSSASTINTVAREIAEDRRGSGESLALKCDVRFYEECQKLITESWSWKRRLDVVVYNSGAIWWSSIENTPMKRFRLMQSINPEGLYGIVQEVLQKWKTESQTEGRIVVISPPIYSRFVKGKTAYASKSDLWSGKMKDTDELPQWESTV